MAAVFALTPHHAARAKYDEGVALIEVRMLATVLAIGTGIWAGGLVTVILVVVTSRTVPASDRVLMFRSFGRKFAIFFGITAVFVIAPAIVLALVLPSLLTAGIAILTIVLLVATGFGVVQARRLTALRTHVDNEKVGESALRRNALVAAIIRTLLVLGYGALLVLAAILAATIESR